MSDEVTVRTARLDDVETIARFNCNLARETEDKPLELATVTRGVTRLLQGVGSGFYIVAEIDGCVVGCLLVVYEWSDWRDGNVWWIHSVYVTAQARRKGVFRAMFASIRERVESDPDALGIRLYVERDNERAQRTYESLGMTQEPYHMYRLFDGV